MKVVPGLAAASVSAPSSLSDSASVESTAAVAGAQPSATLQSATLQPALAALRDMPDVDNAKVAALRDALAKGQLPFDSAKLASLIERYHRGVK